MKGPSEGSERALAVALCAVLAGCATTRADVTQAVEDTTIVDLQDYPAGEPLSPNIIQDAFEVVEQCLAMVNSGVADAYVEGGVIAKNKDGFCILKPDDGKGNPKWEIMMRSDDSTADLGFDDYGSIYVDRMRGSRRRTGGLISGYCMATDRFDKNGLIENIRIEPGKHCEGMGSFELALRRGARFTVQRAMKNKGSR